MTLQSGSRLGPYEILSLLAAGGMGEVYRARDPRLRREVAIKTLPERLAHDQEALARFEREARAVAALSHPNILDIHDVGRDQGISYAVTELLLGETLRQRLARSAMPWPKAVEIATAIAEGLAAAHARGIVHRDLKPENVFLTSDGRVLILDFGLAGHDVSAVSDTDFPTVSHVTEPGTVMGTASYMSPEQVRGGPADRRSDIFSLGAVLYEMVSGRRAFPRNTAAETMTAILEDDPPALVESDQSLPPDLDRIVRHCLEKDRSERFQSARDLAIDLRAIVAGGVPLARKAASRVALLAGAATVAVLAMATGVLLRGRSREAEVRPPGSGRAAADGRKSIAVLPFQNLSPDPENAFFADGMTEDILAQVSNIKDLKVIARTSVMRYKDTQKPIREIASELGVATVLEGSVRRAGNRVRIVSQLIDGVTEEHLWAETYDRDLEDVFDIQSQVAQHIAASLQAKLSAAEKERIEQRPTKSLEAYDLYLEGRELYYRYHKEDNERSIEHFQKALHLDPNFALAHSGLADAYAQRAVRFGFPPTWLDSSIEASQKALSLAPQLAEGYKALGLTYLAKGRLREGLEANRRAEDLKPSFSSAVANLGGSLLYLGRFDEALTWLRGSAEIDPSSAVIWGEALGSTYAALGDDLRAEGAFRRALEIQPELGTLHQALIGFHLSRGRKREALEHARNRAVAASGEPFLLVAAASAERAAGQPARARELLEQALPAVQGQRNPELPEGHVEISLAYLHLLAGRRKDAERLLEASLEADRRHLAAGNEHWAVPLDMACVHALRDEKDEAFRWLDKAIESGWRGYPQASWSPLLDPLRGDERFRKMMARLDAQVAEMRRRAGL